MNKCLFTKLRLDLEAMRKDLLEAFKWIRAQMSLVQTKTMNMVLTANPITVITKLTPDEIIVQKIPKILSQLINARTPHKIQIPEEKHGFPNLTLTNSTKNTLHWIHKWVTRMSEKPNWVWHAGTKEPCFFLLGGGVKSVNQRVLVWESENWDCCIVSVIERMETLELEGMMMVGEGRGTEWE